jgi:hypothetical protein
MPQPGVSGYGPDFRDGPSVPAEVARHVSRLK